MRRSPDPTAVTMTPIARAARAALSALLATFVLCSAGPALAEKQQDFYQKPETYLCPQANGVVGLDCYLNAVEHLYTMCRQVKSIEILEFGYAESDQGVNGAKTEYCIDKHRLSIAKPYQAALREAGGSKAALELLRGLNDLWLRSLDELKWQPPETDVQYKARVALPYEAFHARAIAVHDALVAVKTKVKSAHAAHAVGTARTAAATAPGSSTN